MGWNNLSIPKLQRFNLWSLGMNKQFHPTVYRACDYFSMLGLKLTYVSKRGTMWQNVYLTFIISDSHAITRSPKQFVFILESVPPLPVARRIVSRPSIEYNNKNVIRWAREILLSYWFRSQPIWKSPITWPNHDGISCLIVQHWIIQWRLLQECHHSIGKIYALLHHQGSIMSNKVILCPMGKWFDIVIHACAENMFKYKYKMQVKYRSLIAGPLFYRILMSQT